jgi:hypothetical protein
MNFHGPWFPGPRVRPESQRRKFTSEEDLKLRSLVGRLGGKCWDEIARCMNGRTARQCRDRYKNYLLDSLVLAPWTPEEDQIIMERYQQFGTKWTEIAKFLSGRSGNHIKNRWHRHLAQHAGLPREASNDESTDTEAEGKEEGPSVLLCPVLELQECDWSKLFDQMENSLGYGSASRAVP